MQSVSKIYCFHLLDGLYFEISHCWEWSDFIKINSETCKCLAPVYLRTKE